MTTTQSLQIFLRVLQGQNYSPNTLSTYGDDLTQFLGWVEKNRLDWDSPTRFSRADIEGFMQYLARQGMSGVTRVRKLAAILKFFTFMAENDIIQANPAGFLLRAIKKDHGKARMEQEANILYKEQYKALLYEASDNIRDGGRVMPDDPYKLSITYSSGLIPPPELMSTLAVFYDTIWLPYPYGLDPNGIILWHFDDLRTIDGVPLIISHYQDKYTEWQDQWRILLEQDVFRIVRPPLLGSKNEQLELSYNPNISITRDQILEGDIFRVINSPSWFDENLREEIEYIKRYISDQEEENTTFIHDIARGRIALAIHAIYTYKSNPELFTSNPSDTSTSHLAVSLAQILYSYMVPKIQALNAEQILEVRDYLKDTKEGFAYYINEMTDDVERRIREHNLSDLAASQKTFERKIQPQYEEFRRKLVAKKTGFWSKIAVAGGRFIQVDTAPWTPKFWGAVLEMCGVSLDEFSKAEQENFLSNKSQAFNYIATLESEVSKRSP